MKTRMLFPTAFLSVMLAASLADAGSGAGAVSLQFNTSARAAGMGETGVATIWGGDANVWANPAMLAFRPGVRYGTMHSKLAVGLADDIFIDKKELTFGAYGVGVLYAKGPMDHVVLDMGSQQGTDENGQPTGSFDSWMKSQSWGVGLSAAEAMRQLKIAEIGGWFDVAGGVVWKDFQDQLTGSDVIQGGGGQSNGKASMRDWGWVARVTPVNTLERSAAAADARFGLLLEAAYGRSKLNGTDGMIVHVDVDQSDPAPTAYIDGWALHAEVQAGPAFAPTASARLIDSLSPLLAVTYTDQSSVPGYAWKNGEYIYERDDSGLFDEDGYGWEISLLNIAHIRGGHVEYAAGDIDGDTSGWGLGLQAGHYGGFRYDKAKVPQARGWPQVTRDGWHLWVNALALFGRD